MSLESDAIPRTPEGDAPPGERAGLSGWLRYLGFQGTANTAPPRRWSRHNMCLVSDEAELSAYQPGPRGYVGGTRAAVLAEFSYFEIQAGTTGARVTLSCGTTAAGRYTVTAAQFALNNVVSRTIAWGDTQRRGTSTCRSGSSGLEVSADGASVLLSTTQPEVWLAPGMYLYVWRTTANQAFDAGFSIKEPGSA